MKKIYALFTLLLMTVPCYGQEKSLNLSGIPPWVQYKETLRGDLMWSNTQKQNKSAQQNSPFGKMYRSRFELNYFAVIDPRLGETPEVRDKYKEFFTPLPNDFLPGNLQFLRLRPSFLLDDDGKWKVTVPRINAHEIKVFIRTEL